MKRCPVCQRRYSEAMQFCTRDGTPLSDTSLGVVNHCKLCNKFYPKADGICPVHGIPIAEKLSESGQNAPQTQKIERTEKTLHAVTFMQVFGFSSDDRRLIATLATLTALLLLSLGIYSLTRPAKLESPSSYDDLASTKPSLQEGERQRIELSDGSVSEPPPPPTSRATAESTPERTKQAATNSVKEGSNSQQIQKPNSKTSEKADAKANQTTIGKTNTGQTPPQSAATPQPDGTTPQTASQSAPSSTVRGTPSRSTEPARRESSVEKSPKRHPRVQVTSKARHEIEDGYIYEFDLVVKDATGIRWHSVSGNKVTYSGRSTPIRTVQLEPTRDGSLRYHVSVKMTGRSVEDWYGQVYTTTTGTDEEGRTVRIDQDILLDESFPIIRQVTRY